MSQGKTEFRFTINAAPEAIDQVFKNYLAANQFNYQSKENANYYFFHDPVIKGKRSLEYYINGNQVLVLAYLNTYEKPNDLEGFVGALPKQGYRNDLEPLFNALSALNGGTIWNANQNQNMNMNQQAPQQNQNMNQQGQFMNQNMNSNMNQQGQFMNQGVNMNGYGQAPGYGQQVQGVSAFTEANNKKKEQQVVIGFVISIIGIVISFLGIQFGAIILFLEFYLGAQGLQTSKRGLGIATIVLASISVVLLILTLVFKFTMI